MGAEGKTQAKANCAYTIRPDGSHANRHLCHVGLDRICPPGFRAIPDYLDGATEEWAQPHPKRGRTIQECAKLCHGRSGCTGFRYGQHKPGGAAMNGACATYTGGETNVIREQTQPDYLAAAADWRNCLKETVRAVGVCQAKSTNPRAEARPLYRAPDAVLGKY